MKSFHNWLHENLLAINVQKSVCLNFSKEQCTTVQLNHVDLLFADNVKFLGVVLEPSLKWSSHINSLIPKLSKSLYQLRYLRLSLSFNILKMLYFSNFQSILVYGLILWGGSCHSAKILKLQKQAIRTLFNLSYRESCRPYFIRASIMPLPTLYIFELILFVKNNMNLYELNCNIHQHHTRSNLDIHIKTRSTTLNAEGPYHKGAKLHNSLPQNIKKISNLYKFKIELKNFLIQKPLYSIDEFYALCKEKHK